MRYGKLNGELCVNDKLNFFPKKLLKYKIYINMYLHHESNWDVIF